MKMFLFLLLLFPTTTIYAGILGSADDTFVIAKAVKLGRGKSANMKFKEDHATLALSKSCSAGQYLNEDMCVDCVPGTYSDKAGSKACKACPAGYYSNKDGATSCTQCSAGGNGTCTECDAITGKCTKANCDNGFYSYSENINTYYCGQGSSCGGYSTAVVCKGCPPGTYGANCNACPAGTYSDAYGLTQCKKCVTDKGTCTECDAETGECTKASCNKGYSAYSLNASPYSCGNKTCYHCSAGYACDSYLTGSCRICSAGTYNVDGYCSACPNGSYSETAGATSCIKCKAGYYSTTDHKTCRQCSGQTYSTEGSAECSDNCPKNYYKNKDKTDPDASIHACLPCPAGKFSNGNLTYCTACPQLNGGKCTACPIKEDGTAGFCTAATCDSGYTAAQGATGTTCVSCPVVANGTCTKCNAVWTGGRWNKTCVQLTCNSGYKPSGTTSCVSCSNSTYNCCKCPGSFNLSTGKCSNGSYCLKKNQN